MRAFRGVGKLFLLISSFLSLTFGAFGQATKMAQPHKPSRMEEYVAYCALWRTDASFRSTIRISNQLAISEIDAIPTIYMADGTALELPAVHLAKSGVETVDINTALANAPESLRAHLSSYGSASIRYRYDWQGAVYASMSILDITRGLEYPYGFFFLPEQGKGETHLSESQRAFRDGANAKVYEGLWFRNGRNGGGFLALANTSAHILNVTVTLSGLRNRAERKLSVAAHNTVMIDLKDLFRDDESRTGGITISHTGKPGDLQLAGGLEDLTTGYSANLPIVPAKANRAPDAERQYASVGIMVNEQDAVLGFPSGLKFWPYAFFRNLASETRTLRFSVYYMEGRLVQRLSLPDLVLRPGEAQELSIHDVMKKLPSVADINLVFTYAGDFSDTLEATGSTDVSGNYVFPVRAEPVAPSGAKRSTYWQVSGGFDTMYTVWNPLDRPQQLLATLYYGNGGETFKLPLQIEAHASAMIDVGELIRTQQSDQDGKVIPVAPQQGSLEVSNVSEHPEDLMTAVISGAVYNPQKATCAYTCQVCTGLTGVYLDPNPWGLYVNGSGQGTLSYAIGGGTHWNVTTSSQWTSNATSIATIQTLGQATPGLATGVSPGSTTLNGYYPGTVPTNIAQFCYDGPPPQCPVTHGFGGSAPAPVQGPYQVEPLYDQSKGPANCPSGRAGWVRNVVNQLQTQDGSAYAVLGIAVADTITIGSRNDLGNGTQTGSTITGTDGSFNDTYSVCSTACPGSAGETDGVQSWTENGIGLPHANLIVYKCASISVDGR